MILAGATQVSLLARTGSGEAKPVANIPLSPEFLARYELGPVLGAGAMGMVARARDIAMDRVVAVKFVLQFEADALARFLREGRVMARIRHPNIVAIYDLDQLAGHPYLVAELLEGGTLRERLVKQAVADPISVVSDCLAGLAALHAGGVVHRDLKPENILFTSEGTPKLADLGLAKELANIQSMTRTGALMGTPRYMAPEQARLEQVTPASDLWAMGAILYEMLAGRPPFEARGLADLLNSILTREPAPLAEVPGVSRALAAVVHRALEKDPSRRPASAEAFAAELAVLVGPSPRVAATSAIPRVRASTIVRKPAPRVGTGTVAVVTPGSRGKSTRWAVAIAVLAAFIALAHRPGQPPPVPPPSPASVELSPPPSVRSSPYRGAYWSGEISAIEARAVASVVEFDTPRFEQMCQSIGGLAKRLRAELGADAPERLAVVHLSHLAVLEAFCRARAMTLLVDTALIEPGLNRQLQSEAAKCETLFLEPVLRALRGADADFQHDPRPYLGVLHLVLPVSRYLRISPGIELLTKRWQVASRWAPRGDRVLELALLMWQSDGGPEWQALARQLRSEAAPEARAQFAALLPLDGQTTGVTRAR